MAFPPIERNLNPKAACLKRREEEKAEDGPKLTGHHLGHPGPPHMAQPPFPAMPVSTHMFPESNRKSFIQIIVTGVGHYNKINL
jgi:hypothetical protein